MFDFFNNSNVESCLLAFHNKLEWVNHTYFSPTALISYAVLLQSWMNIVIYPIRMVTNLNKATYLLNYCGAKYRFHLCTVTQSLSDEKARG